MGTAIDHATSRYLTMVQSIPSLDRQQELDLARAYQAGDEEAGRKVVHANLRHVVALALRYRSLGVDVADLVAHGTLGLMEALRRFDPSRGLRLATYANHWVRAEMLTATLKARSMVGGGVGPLGPKYALRMRREHAQLSARHGESSEVLAILAERYRKTPQQIADIMARIEQRDASMDAFVGEGSRTLGDVLAHVGTDAEAASDQRTVERDVVDAVAHATSQLNARERFIVERRLMADDEARLSLDEIGRSFGVSRERARQLEQAAKAKLRTRLQGLASRLELTTAPSHAA